MTRIQAKQAIVRAFRELTGYEIALNPTSEQFDHVTLVQHESETAEQAAKAILESAKI